MKTLARLAPHVQWSFWVWEVRARRYRHPIESWGLPSARPTQDRWVYADYFAADAAFVGSARDNPRLEEGEMKAHLLEQDGLSDQDAEAQITEWEEERTQDDIFVERGPKDTLVWSWVESPVTVFQPANSVQRARKKRPERVSADAVRVRA